MNIPKTVSTAKFDVSKESKSMIAEISELGGNVFGQIYADACDEGVHLFNNNTGRTTSWVVSGINRNNDNDLLYWKLVPTKTSLDRFPELKGWTLTIFND